MEDQFDHIGKDPRFQLSKKKKIIANQDDNRFKKIKSQSKPLKDVRGRPWAHKPLDYVNSLLEKQNAEKLKSARAKQRDDEESDEISSSDSEDGSSTDDDDDNILHDSGESDIEELVENDWDELVKNAPTTENATKRLAVLHFDWDSSRPEDLFLVLESFLPKGGSIKSITVFPSQFGIERMTKEKEVGPLELQNDNSASTVVGDDESKANMLNARKKFRDYQLNKLKYFYGIVELDSRQSAAAVYDQCDGMEYENSGVKLDLRFVDDRETFEVPEDWSHLVRTCSSIQRENYVPKKFETKALRSTKAYLPWDETPKEREEWFRKGFSVENFDNEIDEETLRRYVACSSDEDEDEEIVKPKLSSQQARTLLLSNDSPVDKVNDNQEEEEDDDDIQETKKTPRFEAVSAIVSDDENDSDDDPLEEESNNKNSKKRRKSTKELQTKKRRVNDSDLAGSASTTKRQKRKQLLKQKLKKKMEKDLEKGNMWDNETADDRFDEFLTDPAFTVSSAHPDYKNSKDFINYMKKRKSTKQHS